MSRNNDLDRIDDAAAKQQAAQADKIRQQQADASRAAQKALDQASRRMPNRHDLS